MFLQDNYLEEALKIRNILQEFLKHSGRRPPTILGMREHIFTGRSASKNCDYLFMKLSSTLSTTIFLRVMQSEFTLKREK